jgi:hypothetical protein
LEDKAAAEAQVSPKNQNANILAKKTKTNKPFFRFPA